MWCSWFGSLSQKGSRLLIYSHPFDCFWLLTIDLNVFYQLQSSLYSFSFIMPSSMQSFFIKFFFSIQFFSISLLLLTFFLFTVVQRIVELLRYQTITTQALGMLTLRSWFRLIQITRFVTTHQVCDMVSLPPCKLFISALNKKKIYIGLLRYGHIPIFHKLSLLHGIIVRIIFELSFFLNNLIKTRIIQLIKEVF